MAGPAPSFAFTFQSRIRRQLSPERLAALGVPDGPERRALSDGKPITADGKTIDPEDVLGPPTMGKKLVVVRDAESVDGLSDRVRDADVLVIKATFLDRDTEMARQYGHLTAAKAAMLAVESGVKRLVLTHISGRYSDEVILAEATSIFRESRLAADFDRLVI